MKKIMFTDSLGRLCIMHPVRNTHPEPESLSDEEILQRAMKGIPQDASDVQIIEESEIPSDRYFRNAWVAGQGTVTHDLEKCKDIQKEVLRSKRKPRLEALDSEFMKALESGDSAKQQSVAAEKQRLRDITKHPSLLGALTPEAIKAVDLE